MKKIFIGIVLLFPLVLYPTIINIPEDQPTIQAGIDVAVEGDTILVQPGIYYENIDFDGKNIIVGSLFLTTADSMYISNTIIDGGMNGSVVTFFNGEDTTAVLIGFTIRNGLADYIWGHHFGGGIFCCFANPTMKNLIITHNYAEPDGWGGGIVIGGSNAIIKNVTITENFSSEGSGGIHISANSNPILTNVIIKDNIANWGAGIYCYDRSSALLNKVVICNNTAFIEGGGILCNNNCSLNMTNSTITMNYAPTGAGIFCSGNSHPNILNSILWNNLQQEIYLSGGSSIIINYSDIQGGWAGTGNINEDPVFIDPLNYNFHLTEDSPCIDAGDPNSPPDPDGTVADMGAYYFDQSVGTENKFVDFANEFGLYQNYPNPFNPSGAGRSPTTTISFSLNTENTEDTELIIYNIKGKKIRQYSIFNNQSSIIWDGMDESGKQVTSGIYFYKLKTKDYESVKKMIMLK